MSVQQIGMTMEAVRDVLRNPAALLEKVAKILELFREPVVVLAAQPDVEVIRLCENTSRILSGPGKSRVPAYRRAPGTHRVAPESSRIRFPSPRSPVRRAELRAHETGHRAEMSASADDQRGRDGVIDDPLPAVPLQGFQRLAETQTRTRALQQIVVELAAAYAVADRGRIAGLTSPPSIRPVRKAVIGCNTAPGHSPRYRVAAPAPPQA